MTVNERLQRRLLRRAALNTRLENGCLRAVRRSLAMLTRLAVWHVRRHTDLFVKGERAAAGMPDPDRTGRLEREVLAPLRATVREQLTEVSRTIIGDLLALARLELFDLPQTVQAEVDAALHTPVTTTEALAWPHLEEPWGAVLQEETARPLDEPSIEMVFTAVPEAQVAQLLASATGGSTVATTLERMAETLLAQARTVLVGGLLQGQGVPTVARALQSVLGGARWQSERVVRSEFVRVANQAAILTFDRNAQYLKGVRWVATLDRRSCLQCAQLDGKFFTDIKKAKVPVIDTHPNCRCSLVPVLKAASELGLPGATRASFNGQVPATQKYAEWFRQQDAAFQREVLGPTRYKLWAAGKAQLKDFATAAGVRDVKNVVARVAGRTA